MREVVVPTHQGASNPLIVAPTPCRAISDALPLRPLYAFSLYQAQLKEATSPLVEDLRHRYSETMACIEAAKGIDAGTLDDLARTHAFARRGNAKRLVDAIVEQLIELGEAKGPEAGNAHARLARIGAAFEKVVLGGTLQQQLFGKLAIRLAMKRALIPAPLIDRIARPLIDALIVVLLVGAPTTRDSAVEGLGGLLKLVNDPDPESLLRELKAAREGSAKLDSDFAGRVQRRRLMVLAVAGHPPSRDEFQKTLGVAIETLPPPGKERDLKIDLEGALWDHADLLRSLPAISRQAGDEELPWDTAAILCSAAVLPPVREQEPDAILIAYAAYQESVFRTIDATIRRPGGSCSAFDSVVASAVRAIPRTMTGPPAVCNRRIRATVAILRTAIRLVKLSEKRSETETALEPLFASLTTPTPWANLGIAEGCYRGLPMLLSRWEHNRRLSSLALTALFTHLERPHDFDDLVETHRQLVASSCFRRILITLTEQLHERLLRDFDDTTMHVAELKVERDVQMLFAHPTRRNVLRAFQDRADWSEVAGAPNDIAELVIAAIAFESALLRRTEAMFETWDRRSTVEQVLLTRILAAQLHAVSRDRPEIARHATLRRVYDMQTLAIKEADSMDLVWRILSEMPADAADAADADIQRFIEYRGAKNRDHCSPADRVEDLPGYVLAMIQPHATSRIAGAIAREIDLNLRHERVVHPADVDFAKSLYQVMLRGPHESIFDHLKPRISDPRDVQMVELFRKHVERVLHSPLKVDGFDSAYLVQHIDELLDDLRGKNSPTLLKLNEALTLYRQLASEKADTVTLLRNGALLDLFCLFDKVAGFENGEKPASEDHRKRLEPLYDRRLRALQMEMTHYRELPVGSFSDRANALSTAADIARDIETALGREDGLQPPERVLFISLMQHLRRFFERTIVWYCNEPRRRKEEQDKDGFWILFTREPSGWTDPLQGTSAFVRRERVQESVRKTAARIDRLRGSAGQEPPLFHRQSERFEEFFVDWMASDLDVQTLKQALWDRWPPWFQEVYGIMTSFLRMALLILFPCVIAALFHLLHVDWFAGIGFFLIALGMLVAVLLSFTHLIDAFKKRVPRVKEGEEDERSVSAKEQDHEERKSPQKSGYWFQSMLPRLARLIAVPMALIVEFDHSYAFPMHASTWALLLLMALAILTTRFFVTREIVDQTERPGVFDLKPDERSRVRQIVAVALAHAFGIAVLLSMIFASSHVEEMKVRERAMHAALGDPTTEKKDQPFLGVLPRESEVDFGEAWRWLGFRGKPEFLRDHGRFVFYPTIILTWTALGLFFGVFLEGFLKGERLRGGTPRATAVTDS